MTRSGGDDGLESLSIELRATRFALERALSNRLLHEQNEPGDSPLSVTINDVVREMESLMERIADVEIEIESESEIEHIPPPETYVLRANHEEDEFHHQRGGYIEAMPTPVIGGMTAPAPGRDPSLRSTFQCFLESREVVRRGDQAEGTNFWRFNFDPER